MPQGMDSWVIPIKADIDTLKKQLKEAQSELDHITDGDHTVKLDIDTKSLDSAMQNLDKMLKSIGKGTGDFKQFENLSRQFNEMRSNIENVKKSLGTLNADKGMKNILTAINSIDSSLTTLIANLKGVTSINTGSAEKEIKDLASAGDKAADSMERAAQARKKLAETDLSSEVILPSDSDFNGILKNLNRAKSELKEIVEITKQVNYDKDGHRRESYTLKDKYGSTEIYGKSSKTDDGNIIKKNIKDSSLKEAQAAQKSAEAQAKAEAKRQEQLAKAKASALSKSRQNAKNETQTSVNNAVKQQLESWREIQKIKLQMSKTTDTGEISRLEAMKKVEQERYLAATKILNVNRELYDYEAQSYKLQKASKDTTNAIATNQTKEQAKAAEAQVKAIRNQKSAVDSMVSSSQRLVNGFSHKNNVHPSDKYVETVKKATGALTEMENIQKKINDNQNGVVTKEQIEDLKKYEKEIKKCKEEISNMPAAEKGSTNEKATKEIKKIYEGLEKNSRMSSEAKAQLHGYITELKNNPSANVEEIATAWKKVVIAEKEAGRGGKSLLSAVGEKAFYGLAGQIANFVSLYDVINVIKQAASEVTQLNTDITDLAKVSEQSVKQIYSDFSSYADIAKEMGGTISDTISATTAWAKNGYSIPDSKELARVSLLYKNVGDDITIDEANESLVSTLQGYKLAADDAEHIVDVFNEVSNNEAISSAGIGEALQRSAASFNAANTSLEQSVALVSATNSVLQDPEKVGGAYIADLYSNVMKIKVAISVNVQRWIRPSKDLYVFI